MLPLIDGSLTIFFIINDTFALVKRIILILLISIYTTASFGFSVKQFYCCHQLKSTSIAFTPSTDKKCGMDDKMDNCCKTKYTYCKVKDNHFGESAFTGLSNNYSMIALQSFEKPNPFTIQVFSILPFYSNPPHLHRAIPIYKLDCIFRI